MFAYIQRQFLFLFAALFFVGILFFAFLFFSPAVHAQVSYGVHIDEVAEDISGYAWNEGVGWIDFTNVGFDAATGNFTGTAEIIEITNLGGDGIVQMQGDCTPTCGGYGVSLNGSNEVVGYAWNEQIGWIEFSHAFGPPTHSTLANPSVDGWAWNDNIGWIRMSDVITICGNSVVEGAETCDDGNTVSGDGCSDVCQTEGPVSFGVHVDQGANDISNYAWNENIGWIDFNPATFDSATDTFQGIATIVAFDDAGQDGDLILQGDCTPSCGGFGVSINGSNQIVGYAWNSIIGWVEFAPAFGGVYYSPAVNPSTSGYAWNDLVGWIEMSSNPQLCGNGIVEGAEVCDDGNLTEGDGCSAICQLETEPGPCSVSPFNTCSWAWSDTMGWIAHNSVDDPATPVFGMHIPPAGGALEGHAWNDLLGYIDFTGGSYDQTTGEISGTAQILDLGGNGTMQLRGDCTPSCGGYGVSVVGDQVTGFAWNDTIGWIDFQPSFGGVTFNEDASISVSGWAWNDSYGWIAFRFTNYELEWGVNLETNGNFTGYAWNDIVGWLNYDHPGPYPAAPTNSARWDSTTEEVSGWVYADGLAAGGADPWILLRDNGAVPFGVSMNGLTGRWSGWAWSDEFGWIAYDHTHGNVRTEFGAGGPATPILTTPLECVDTYTINPNAGLTPALDWSDYAALDGTGQLNYQVQVDTDPLFSAPIIDEVVNSTSSIYTVGLGILNYNATYYWRVRVESTDNEWSEWGELGPSAESNCFRTPLHAPPECSFTMNPSPATVDNETQFTDTSTLYGGATGAFWDWDYGDGNTQFGSDPIENQNPSHTYTEVGDVTITFRHVDSDGYECTTTSDEQVVLQLPEFRRVIPR